MTKARRMKKKTVSDESSRKGETTEVGKERESPR